MAPLRSASPLPRLVWLGALVGGCGMVPARGDRVREGVDAEGTTNAAASASPKPEGSLAASREIRASGAAPNPPREDDKLTAVVAELEVMATTTTPSGTLGTIRAGGFARLRQEGEVGKGSAACPAGWYAVLPGGFVCSERVTRDPYDANARVYAEYALASGAALPASYGFAEPTPLYNRIPTAAEQARAEPGIEQRQNRTNDAGSFTDVRSARIEVPTELRASPIAPGRPLPLAPDLPVVGLLDNRARVAWVAEFDAPARSWLLTPELLFVPSDKVKRAAISAFHGVEVPDNAGVAFIGNQGVPRYLKSDAGARYLPQRQIWPPLTPVLLAEPALQFSDEDYLETSEPGVFIRANEVIVAHPTPPSRWGIEPTAKFIEINARTNLLLVHEADRVTFATLISVGRLGAVRGKFRLYSKHLTAASLLDLPHAPSRGAETPEVMRMTDTPDSPNELTAIPMYAAWWANGWGSRGGGPGIALAPLDARRIFDATEPALPEGWHSVRREGTWVVIHD